MRIHAVDGDGNTMFERNADDLDAMFNTMMTEIDTSLQKDA